jgi:hypothetical protein
MNFHPSTAFSRNSGSVHRGEAQQPTLSHQVFHGIIAHQIRDGLPVVYSLFTQPGGHQLPVFLSGQIKPDNTIAGFQKPALSTERPGAGFAGSGNCCPLRKKL